MSIDDTESSKAVDQPAIKDEKLLEKSQIQIENMVQSKTEEPIPPIRTRKPVEIITGTISSDIENSVNKPEEERRTRVRHRGVNSSGETSTTNGHSQDNNRNKITVPSEIESRTPETRRREIKKIPFLIARLRNRSAAELSIIKMTCAVSDADCTAKWMKDGVVLNNREKYEIDNSNGVLTLEIIEATKEDSGEYACVISNKYGEAETSANISIFKEETKDLHTSVFTRNLKGRTEHSQTAMSKLIIHSTSWFYAVLSMI